MFVSKKTRRQIGHHVCLRDVMSQTHPIYACAGNNHARHLISSQCISLQLEARAFKVTLDRWKVSRVWNSLVYNFNKFFLCKAAVFIIQSFFLISDLLTSLFCFSDVILNSR